MRTFASAPCPACGREILWSSRCTLDKVTTQPWCWCLLAVTE